MNRTQKYISLLLERLPKYELRSYEHQTTLDRLRDRISATTDIHAELLSLYKVQNCAEFALSLLWIEDKVEKDVTKEESTIDEETLVFSKFRQVVGDISPSEHEAESGGSVLTMAGSSGADVPPAPDSTSTFDFGASQETGSIPAPETPIDSIFGAMSETPPSSPASNQGGAPDSGQELQFASLLERFLEAVQSGNDDRTPLLNEITSECRSILASVSAVEDYKQFCKLLTEFLEYISNNQYMDDVRVMNILSNIQDPFAQWAHSAPENRSGLLDPVNDILRDFKTMFE